jgi:hypothetical protein
MTLEEISDRLVLKFSGQVLSSNEMHALVLEALKEGARLELTEAIWGITKESARERDESTRRGIIRAYEVVENRKIALSAPADVPVAGGSELIAKERRRQVEAEGWTPEHDDDHTAFEMTGAAICYAKLAAGQKLSLRRWWPWSLDWWKPEPGRVRNLVKAGALIAAEIDRLMRAGDSPS